MPEAHRIKKANDGNEGPAKHPGTRHTSGTFASRRDHRKSYTYFS